jgi:pimeloyl-ACP methyl ester carboxylesterase
MNTQADYVFLHGGGQGSWVWSETLAALNSQTDSKFGRALALDIPGCGAKRERATKDLDVPTIVAGLIEEIQSAGFRDVVLVGHSQAGTILPLLVEAQPKLFRRLVYVSCVAPLPGQTVLEWRSTMPPAETALATLAAPGSRERYHVMFCNDMTLEEAQKFIDKLGEDTWPACSYEMSDWRYGHLEAVPSSYVVCLQDATLVPPWQGLFAERFKVSRVIQIDAGHQVMNTRPQALAEVLRIEAAVLE